LGAEVLLPATYYGLELIDAITQGSLIGRSAVTETSSGIMPFLVNRARWVFANLPPSVATFVITAPFYVEQTVTTGGSIPNPPASGAGFLLSVQMMPRTGYPFSPTLTRVVGLVRLAASVNPTSPIVPNATVTLQPSHYDPVGGTTTFDPPVTVPTTDDGQFTYWFLPMLTETPAIANQLTGTVADGSGHTGIIPLISFLPNGVTYAPTVYIH
jgi:hypothetical protein